MYWVSVWTVHGVTLRIVRIVYCRVDKKPPSVPILSHINPLHTLQSLFLKILLRYFQVTTSSPRPCVKFCNIQTCFLYYKRFFFAPCAPPLWSTTPSRLSASVHLVCSKLSSTSEGRAIPSATWGSAMSWRQEPTRHAWSDRRNDTENLQTREVSTPSKNEERWPCVRPLWNVVSTYCSTEMSSNGYIQQIKSSLRNAFCSLTTITEKRFQWNGRDEGEGRWQRAWVANALVFSWSFHVYTQLWGAVFT